MRKPLLVDIEALETAVREAALPARLAFPIFDAAGLRQHYQAADPNHPAVLPTSEAHPQDSTSLG
jgi:hypothetical protein